MRGLYVKEPWIDMILAGTKTWEIRGSAVNIRGRIALLRSGAGQVAGVCDVVDCVGPLTLDDLRANETRTGFPTREPPYDATFAWVLANAVRLTKPVPFSGKRGAIKWLELDAGVVAAIEAQL